VSAPHPELFSAERKMSFRNNIEGEREKEREREKREREREKERKR
jgi:hypothetical protein